jgi:hypothetical protein
VSIKGRCGKVFVGEKFMYGITNGKIIRRKGKGYYSFNFLIVKNRRNPETGKAGYQVVFNFGTIRDYEFVDRAKAFWQEVESVLTALVRDNKIYSNDADKIRGQFGKYIARPIISPAVPLPIYSPVQSAKPKVTEQVHNRFGNMLD